MRPHNAFPVSLLSYEARFSNAEQAETNKRIVVDT